MEFGFIYMLLLQQLCATLLDQMCGVQMHFPLLLELYQLLSQLAAPGWPKQIVYNCIAFLLQALANNRRDGCLQALQRQSAQSTSLSYAISTTLLCSCITYSVRVDKCVTTC